MKESVTEREIEKRQRNKKKYHTQRERDTQKKGKREREVIKGFCEKITNQTFCEKNI